jgi:hypothetical protein
MILWGNSAGLGGEVMSDILKHWSITVEELSQAILDNGSLRGMVFGYVAEIKLRKLLSSNSDVTSYTKDDDHDRSKKGDLRIVYRGHEFKIESKSLQTARNKVLGDGSYSSVAQVDASDRRSVTMPDGSKLQTTNLLVGEFDVLSVNCFTFQNEWRFVFARNKDLPRSTFRNYSEEQRQHLLATTVSIAWPPQGIFTDDIFALLDSMIKERMAKAGPVETMIVQEGGKPPEIVKD